MAALVASASQYSAELGGGRWREIMAGWIFPNGRMAGRRLHLWLRRLPRAGFLAGATATCHGASWFEGEGD